MSWRFLGRFFSLDFSRARPFLPELFTVNLTFGDELVGISSPSLALFLNMFAIAHLHQLIRVPTTGLHCTAVRELLCRVGHSDRNNIPR